MLSLTRRFGYAPAFMVLMLLYLHAQAPALDAIRTDGWWLGGFWYVTYELGFVARGLVGTLVALYSKQIAPAAMNHLIICCWTALALVVALCAGRLVRYAPEGERPVALYLITILLLLPCGYTQYCNSEMLGKLDLFFQPLLMASSLWLLRGGSPYLLAAPLLLGVMIHPAFAFVGGPTLLAWAFWRVGWRRAWTLLPLALATLALLVWFTLRGAPTGGPSALNALLEARCPLPQAGNQQGFFFAYFADLGDHLASLRQHGCKFITTALLTHFVILAPAWLLPLGIWYHALKNSTPAERLPLFCVSALPLLLLLPLLVTLDWTRWLGLLLVCHYLSLLVLYLGGCRSLCLACAALQRQLHRHPVVAVALLLWLALLPRTDVAGLLLNSKMVVLIGG